MTSAGMPKYRTLMAAAGRRAATTYSIVLVVSRLVTRWGEEDTVRLS
jgi:hypothetical protein